MFIYVYFQLVNTTSKLYRDCCMRYISRKVSCIETVVYEEILRTQGNNILHPVKKKSIRWWRNILIAEQQSIQLDIHRESIRNGVPTSGVDGSSPQSITPLEHHSRLKKGKGICFPTLVQGYQHNNLHKQHLAPCSHNPVQLQR